MKRVYKGLGTAVSAVGILLSGCNFSASLSGSQASVTLFSPSVCAGGAVQSGSVGGFVFVQSQVPQAERPPQGTSINEAGYSLCLTRLTDAQSEPPAGFARTDYSRRQSFNADGSRMLVVAQDGAWHLYDPRVPVHVQQLTSLAGPAEPQWDPVNPDVLWYLPDAGKQLQLHELDVATSQLTLSWNFAQRLQSLWPSAAQMNTGAEGSPSADARYWAFQVSDVSGQGLGVFVWDRLNDVIVSSLSIDSLPDHLSMSPSGNHVVVSWRDQTLSYDRQLGNPRRLLDGSEHSDLAIGEDGHDYYVAIDYAYDDGDLFMTNLDTGVRTPLVPTYIDGHATTLHVSGKAYNKPGWVVVSTYDNSGEDPQWLYQRIWLVQLRADPVIYPLAYHQSRLNTVDSIDNYWAEPHASVNPDLTRVVFNSNWHSADVTGVDVYVLDVPSIDTGL